MARALALHRARRHARRARHRAGRGARLRRCRRRARAVQLDRPLLPVDPEAEALVRCLARRHVSRAPRGPSRSSLPAPAGARSAGRPSATLPSRAASRERGMRVAGQRRPRRGAARRAHRRRAAQSRSPPRLPQLIALTRRIALCVGGDTGPLHLACALGRPVVGIYGPTDPSRNGPLRHARTRAAQLRTAAATTRAAPRPTPACSPSRRTTSCAPPTNCSPRRVRDDPAATTLLQRSAPCNGGSRVARRIRVPLGFLTAAVYLFEVARRAPHPAAIAWSLALVLPGLALARGCLRHGEEESRAHRHRSVRLHAQPALSWIHAHCRGLCGGAAQLAGGAAARSRLRRDLHSGHRFGRAISARHVSRVRRYCRSVPRFIPRLTPAKLPRQRAYPPFPSQLPKRPAGGFSFALYLKHREYNAAIGAALLYLSLLFLRPVLEIVLHRA